MNTKINDLKSKLSGGVAPAMATPLLDDGYRVNTAVLPQLVEFLLEAGVAGLFVGGTTGEGILLDEEERRRLHEAAITAVNGRVPVLLHVGANQMRTAVALAQHAADLGADAIAAVTPYFYGVDEDSLAAYYHAIAMAVPNIPLLLYDIPHLAVNGITPPLLSRLCAEIPNLAGMKTSRPDAQIVRQLLDAGSENAIMLVGNERIALGLLALGADGMISGLSTAVPEPFVALTSAINAGDQEQAQAHQRRINQLLQYIPVGQRVGTIKKILTERGISVGPPVPPRPEPAGPIWPQLAAING